MLAMVALALVVGLTGAVTSTAPATAATGYTNHAAWVTATHKAWVRSTHTAWAKATVRAYRHKPVSYRKHHSLAVFRKHHTLAAYRRHHTLAAYRKHHPYVRANGSNGTGTSGSNPNSDPIVVPTSYEVLGNTARLYKGSCREVSDPTATDCWHVAVQVRLTGGHYRMYLDNTTTLGDKVDGGSTVVTVQMSLLAPTSTYTLNDLRTQKVIGAVVVSYRALPYGVDTLHEWDGTDVNVYKVLSWGDGTLTWGDMIPGQFS